MYRTVRNLLFRLGAERSHDIAMGALSALSHCRYLTSVLRKANGDHVPELPVEVMGIRFSNPVGLAAGLDKQASACGALDALGFGWLELGTVTPQPQPGNCKPRMFRLQDRDALINRMGFNSTGLSEFLVNVQKAPAQMIKGINIGKNAATAIDRASDDYLAGLEAVYPHADYVCINISSPNTRNLRELQQQQALDDLLGVLNRKRNDLVNQHGRAVPLVLKVSPDLEDNEIDDIAQLSRKHKMDAIAATNTTVTRAGIENHPLSVESGGLSGRPLRERSTAVIHRLHRNLEGEIALIGLGGIDSPDSAREKFQAGADLVQLYTGFIYQGPALIRQIVESLADMLTAEQRWEDGLRLLRTKNGFDPV